ncbi:hypothetical protein [Methanobrevibacter curvatus]|uniref:Uncharacterized protein n=1 Tax=Methanobrevibacter curvatus TaxID=49547 RepID=A0A166CAM6_9EURY|nr:hypothetical protein [Methanobrevibacter curvatus]KZX14305.1 hypothetical protein MBCUR_05290 [Methanobrevibacter curvatus]
MSFSIKIKNKEENEREIIPNEILGVENGLIVLKNHTVGYWMKNGWGQDILVDRDCNLIGYINTEIVKKIEKSLDF